MCLAVIFIAWTMKRRCYNPKGLKSFYDQYELILDYRSREGNRKKLIDEINTQKYKPMFLRTMVESRLTGGVYPPALEIRIS